MNLKKTNYVHNIFCFLFVFIGTISFLKAQSQLRSNLFSVPDDISKDSIATIAAYVLPTQRQYNWQQLEFTAFLHFGMNTFTGREWGTGKESPTLFQPTSFDAKQWIKVLKGANMKMAMLTAKHHDGFCLWQTQTTAHSVKNTPWKDGKGDVLKDLVVAAHDEGIKVGIYLSPADLHEFEREGGTYGNGSPQRWQMIPSNPNLQKKADTIFSYFLDDYDALFMNQMYEVLTQYGKISEVWFDGANPAPGTGQLYNTEAWYGMIRQLQPEAVIAIKGPDVRWVGNEAGKSRANEWSVLPLSCHPSRCDWTDKVEEDLGSRRKLENTRYLYWYPAETDTPIRDGWFYRDEKQYVRSVEELLDIWYRSVGNNSVLLLNLSPDRRGLIPYRDSARMADLGIILQESFRENLLENAELVAKATADEKSIASVLSKELNDSWKTKDGTVTATITADFGTEKALNRIVLQEDVRNYGQRIEAFVVKIWKNNRWQQIAEDGTVGYKKIVRFPKQYTQKLQLHITQSRVSPSLGFLGVYEAPEMLSVPNVKRNKEGIVSISCQTLDPIIYYTTDGTMPSLRYVAPFLLERGGVVKAVAKIVGGKKQSEMIEVEYDICARDWTAYADGQVPDYEAAKAIDGNEKTFWHTPRNQEANKLPHQITIDLGHKEKVKGVCYVPRQDGSTEGVCRQYCVEGSDDGKVWEKLAEGRFANMKNNPTKKQIRFPSKSIRYLRFVGLESVGKAPYLSVAELSVLTR